MLSTTLSTAPTTKPHEDPESVSGFRPGRIGAQGIFPGRVAQNYVPHCSCSLLGHRWPWHHQRWGWSLPWPPAALATLPNSATGLCGRRPTSPSGARRAAASRGPTLPVRPPPGVLGWAGGPLSQGAWKHLHTEESELRLFSSFRLVERHVLFSNPSPNPFC